MSIIRFGGCLAVLGLLLAPDGRAQASSSPGYALADFTPNRCAIAERRPEIADDQPREKVTVLRQKRSIEAELRAQVAKVRGRCRLTEHRRRRIAGDEVNQRKHQCRHTKEHRHSQDKSADDE